MPNYNLILLIISSYSIILTDSVITPHHKDPKNHLQHDINIHKVSFTQKGYIQFLKYIAEVPPIQEFTFCIWIRSENLTFSHPILSYSKHEEERLIRSWISPHGTYLHLNIYEIPVFKIPINFKENHWYHICESWSSSSATYNLYLNGKLKSSGHSHQLQDVAIKEGGDIVVGQEYTDFDKGLDDGIEGDVFGFNFVTSSTNHLPLRRHYTNRYIPLKEFESNRKSKIYHRKRIGNEIETFKTNGLRLVELGYRCFIGKGAPVRGKDVLVSWTQTPVRVFGGAILKHIPPFCL